MWTRSELKDRAKTVLRGTYWKSFAVAVIAAVLSFDVYIIQNFERLLHWFISFPSITLKLPIWLCIADFAIAIFVADVIQIGTKRFFIRNRDGETNIANLFSGFRRGYWNIVGAQFTTGLIIILWAILLIVPGIIACYKYSMVPYLLSENPEMSGTQARELSARMTDGQKADLFALDLSFFGWRLAGTVCFGIGILFVIPYLEATKAELYIILRDRLKPVVPDEPEKESDGHAPMEP